jgi:release factor glutamine methyltransferase
MKTLSYKELLKEFFSLHQKSLEKLYPGIHQQILEKHFKSYLQVELDQLAVKNTSEYFKKLEEGTPLEYIIGEAFFYRYPFYVNSNVLIPRDETEILVEDCSQYINKQKQDDITLLDIGSGSGNIVLSLLAECPKVKTAYALDISSEALEVLKMNYLRLRHFYNKDQKLEIIKSDRLKALDEKLKFDVIVSNPPYISLKDKDGVHRMVDQNEPHVALYLKEEEYGKWFDDFFAQSSAYLKQDGKLFMEGHEDQLEELSTKALNYFSHVELKKDYTRRLRFLYATR